MSAARPTYDEIYTLVYAAIMQPHRLRAVERKEMYLPDLRDIVTDCAAAISSALAVAEAHREAVAAILPGEPTGACEACKGSGDAVTGYGMAMTMGRCPACNGTGRTPASTGKAGEG